MHGRLKVKSSAQQEAEKKAERAAKAKAYKHAMHTILEARDKGEAGEAQMRMVSGVLLSNPDITVLWNIRKETLVKWKEEKKAADMDSVLNKELELSQQCLMTNPKSYGAWHHRYWCLGQMEKANWAKEIALCDKYLALDERNFHCWDYRHLISQAAERSSEEELNFTEERIRVNFSNYSAWHFRSKLLPQVYPCEEKGIGIQKDKWLSELDWATEAVFTDPEDSSVWFYHTWLLGHKETAVDILGLKLNPLQGEVRGSVLLSSHVPNAQEQLRLKVNKVLCSKSTLWSPGESKIWHFELDRSTLEGISDSILVEVAVGDSSIQGTASTNEVNIFPKQRSSMVPLDVLQKSLESTKELLDLEPDSKWTRLSLILIMKAIGDPCFEEEILEHYDRLIEIDSLRRGYYLDMKQKSKETRTITKEELAKILQ